MSGAAGSDPRDPAGEVVRYARDGQVAGSRSTARVASQPRNSAMTYALDAALRRAVEDDDVHGSCSTAPGRATCAGHDRGTPGRDVDRSFPRVASPWYDHVGRSGPERTFAREQEVYLGMCRRWREIPKPTIRMVHGACIAGGLMLAWS